MKNFRVEAQSYQIIEFLGEGSNSCVYRAFKTSKEYNIRHEVAVKILKSEKLVAIWRNEFERLKRVRSEYCVKLLGWEVTAYGPALIIEYVNGITLAELQTEHLLSETDINSLKSQVWSGLDDLAKSRLFHGDLSPQNIMLNSFGEVKLIDFGVEAENKGRLLTPRYSAPSVIAGAQPNFETDLFSLELIVAEMHELNINSIGKNIETMSLAEKVSATLKNRLQLRAKTRSTAFKAVNINLSRYQLLHVLAIVLFMATAMISQRDSMAARMSEPAHLIVNTNKWVQLEIDGKEVGFAPINVPINGEHDFVLSWRSHTKTGAIRMKLKPGEIATLNDLFFNQ